MNFSPQYNCETLRGEPLEPLSKSYFDVFWKNMPKYQLIELYHDINVLSMSIAINTQS